MLPQSQIYINTYVYIQLMKDAISTPYQNKLVMTDNQIVSLLY
jgi:hypothetical protein